MERYKSFSEVESTPTLPPIQELQESDKAAFGYATIHKYIGIIGIFIPLAIFLASFFSEIQLLPSISDYYYTLLSPIFTGGLLLISVFLFATKSSDFTEDLLNKIAAGSGVIVILFPTTIIQKFRIIANRTYTSADFSHFVHYSRGFSEYVGYLHLLGAFAFFTTLVIIVFKKFIPFEKAYETKLAIQKIKLYKICGFGMIVNLAIILISFFFFEKLFGIKAEDCIFPITFTCESILLLFFGTSWLVKSNSLDKQIKGIIKKG